MSKRKSIGLSSLVVAGLFFTPASSFAGGKGTAVRETLEALKGGMIKAAREAEELKALREQVHKNLYDAGFMNMSAYGLDYPNLFGQLLKSGADNSALRAIVNNADDLAKVTGQNPIPASFKYAIDDVTYGPGVSDEYFDLFRKLSQDEFLKVVKAIDEAVDAATVVSGGSIDIARQVGRAFTGDFSRLRPIIENLNPKQMAAYDTLMEHTFKRGAKRASGEISDIVRALTHLSSRMPDDLAAKNNNFLEDVIKKHLTSPEQIDDLITGLDGLSDEAMEVIEPMIVRAASAAN